LRAPSVNHVAQRTSKRQLNSTTIDIQKSGVLSRMPNIVIDW